MIEATVGETRRSLPPATPLRLTGRYADLGLATAVDSFGDAVEPGEEYRLAQPVRTIVITEAMRQNDARQQQERAAALAPKGWAIKAELRVENLIAAKTGGAIKPSVVKPGRIAEPLGRVPVAVGQPTQPPAQRRPARRPGTPTLAKPCRWCGEPVAGFYAHRKHEQLCPQRVAGSGRGRWKTIRVCPWCKVETLGAVAERAHQHECAAKPVKRTLCATGCGRVLRNGVLRREDGVCGVCYGVKTRKAKRWEKRDRVCTTCGVKLYMLAKGDRCQDHLRKPTTIGNHTEEDRALNEGWKALSLEEKRIVMECLAANVEGALEAGTHARDEA